MADLSDTGEWRTSSRSSGGNCVEVRRGSTTVLIRDSKDRGGATLAIDRAAFEGFLDDLKAGRFDRPHQPEEESYGGH